MFKTFKLFQQFKTLLYSRELNMFTVKYLYYYICFQNNVMSFTQILSTIIIRFYLLHESFSIYQIPSFIELYI